MQHQHQHHSSDAGALPEHEHGPPQVNLPRIMHPPPPYATAPPNTMANGQHLQQHTHHQQHHQQQQQQHAPPFPNQMYTQYATNGAMPAAPMPASVATNGQNGVLRYPIPPQPQSLDQRQMSGGRHKKEIKRRTKTGCLTCRKRRIKCDEAQPSCRNCHKSKRECLGYDPIFKQQPSPANIQPAPAGSIASPVVHQQAHTPNPNLPQNPYQQQPPSYQGGGSAAYAPAPAPGPTPAHGEQQHFEPHYSNGTSLDPALSSANQTQQMAPNSHPFEMQPTRRVRVIPMDDLFALHDIPPRYNLREAPPPVTAATQQELETFYKYHYAIGLDRLFETTWYSQHGLAHLQRDIMLQDFVMQCAEQFKGREDANGKQTMSTEARLVWLLAVMPRHAYQQLNGAAGDPSLYELLPRIDVIENLLTGGYLEPSRVTAPPHQQTPLPPGTDSATANQKHNERAFWHHLARFTALRDDTASPAVEKDINEALGLLRNLLSMLENRDVIYSLAVGRHIGGRMPDFHPQRRPVPQSTNQNDPTGKLSVACNFVEQEDARGTTQVIQRICSMAIRAWCLQKQ